MRSLRTCGSSWSKQCDELSLRRLLERITRVTGWPRHVQAVAAAQAEVETGHERQSGRSETSASVSSAR